MNYVVVDLEWNQAMSSKSSVFNKLPIKLRGEIIEIGAVKLTQDMQPAEEFTIDVKPVYFKRMHYKVKKLTGFDKERLALGHSFPDAFEQFKQWCGEDVTFLTWGCDDRGIMEQNIIIHDLDWDWINSWINLQLIYNMQTDGDKNQKSLATAMEHFGIEQTRVAHDALGDAYNTALVCSKLDMELGLAQYDEASRMLSTRARRDKPDDNAPDAIEHIVFPGYVSKADAFADEELTGVPVPEMSGRADGSALDQSGRSAIHECSYLSGMRQLPCPPQVPQARGQHMVCKQARLRSRRGYGRFLPQQGRTFAPPRPRTFKKEKPSCLKAVNFKSRTWSGISACRKTNPIHQATAGFRSRKRKTARKSG